MEHLNLNVQMISSKYGIIENSPLLAIDSILKPQYDKEEALVYLQDVLKNNIPIFREWALNNERYEYLRENIDSTCSMISDLIDSLEYEITLSKYYKFGGYLPYIILIDNTTLEIYIDRPDTLNSQLEKIDPKDPTIFEKGFLTGG